MLTRNFIRYPNTIIHTLHRALATALVTATILGAQTTSVTGVIQGLVTDSTGATVPACRVAVRQQDTGLERTAITTASGQFLIGNLAPGTYTLNVDATGFMPIRVKPFPLAAGHVIAQDFELKPAGLNERVEVKEEPEAIDLTASSASVSLGYERIEEAPARSRNYLNFVLAAPGVAPSAGSSSQRTMTGTRTTLGDSGFTFGGMRPRNNAIQIDGLDNRDETTGGNRVAVGLEMVQEFRVSGTAVGAELGGASGGLLNMITRSGVNILHGDFTMFAQNELFNARRAEVAATRPRFRRYQPGMSANGPLRRDRTFLAGAVEHENESAEEWSNVPGSALAEINRALASPLYSGTAGLRVLRGLYPTSTRGTDLSLKLNHQAGPLDTLSTRYAFSRGRVRNEVQGPDNFPDRSAQGSSLTGDHSLVGNWLRVITPRVVNDVRLQLAQRTMDLDPNSGLAVPMFEIPGVATLGQFYRMNSRRTERHYQIVEQLNFTLGAHRLSTGFDLHQVTLDSEMRNRYAGIYLFPTLDAFTQGRPDLFIQAFGRPATRMNTLPAGLWLQDRWQLRPRLLIELGGRFDRQRMPAGISSSSSNLSPRAGLAWRPSATRPLVMRAAFGLFFDRYPLAFLNEALQKDGRLGFEQFAAGAPAIAALTLSRGAILTAPLAGVPNSEYHTASRFPSTYSRKLSAGFEHGLGKDTSLSVEATQIRGFHLPRIRNTAGILPPTYELEQTARATYTGVSATLNHRLSRELTYLVAYNLGRTLDDGSDFDEQPGNPLNIRQDWAHSRQHQLHRLTASAVFEVPFIDDVSLAPILSAGSGRPINALLTTDAYRTGAYPLSARPAGVSRNSFRSPANLNLDVRLMKTFHVKDRALLQFGIEGFNLTNHANIERVSPYYSNAAGRLASFGQPLESLPARQLQFLVQFEY